MGNSSCNPECYDAKEEKSHVTDSEIYLVLERVLVRYALIDLYRLVSSRYRRAATMVACMRENPAGRHCLVTLPENHETHQPLTYAPHA